MSNDTAMACFISVLFDTLRVELFLSLTALIFFFGTFFHCPLFIAPFSSACGSIIDKNAAKIKKGL